MRYHICPRCHFISFRRCHGNGKICDLSFLETTAGKDGCGVEAGGEGPLADRGMTRRGGDGIGNAGPAGLPPAGGAWASVLAAALRRANLPALISPSMFLSPTTSAADRGTTPAPMIWEGCMVAVEVLDEVFVDRSLLEEVSLEEVVEVRVSLELPEKDEEPEEPEEPEDPERTEDDEGKSMLLVVVALVICRLVEEAWLALEAWLERDVPWVFASVGHGPFPLQFC